jgi:hypothetical protein
MNLTDAEYQTALATVRTAASAVGAEVAVMLEKDSTGSTGSSIPADDKGENATISDSTATSTVDGGTFKSSYVMIRKTPKSAEELLEVRVAVVGNVVCFTLSIGIADGAMLSLVSFC